MRAILNHAPIEIEDDLNNLLLYGLGVYSSFIVSNKNMVRGWEYHIQRIQRDAKQFLGIDVTRCDISKNLMAFMKDQNIGGEMAFRVTIYPGSFNLGTPHKADSPRILVTGISGSSLSGKPLNLTVFECDRPYAAHKTTNIGAAMKERAKARLSGFDDALFTANRQISEGPTWNIFFELGGTVYTPKNNGKILPGVTRRLVMKILGESVEEVTITSADLSIFDSVFATNSAIGVVPVESIDGMKFNHKDNFIKSLQDRYLSFPEDKIFYRDHD